MQSQLFIKITQQIKQSDKNNSSFSKQTRNCVHGPIELARTKFVFLHVLHSRTWAHAGPILATL
jgi:hypothetical protein